MENYEWTMTEIDNLNLSHIFELMERKERKMEEERIAKLQNGLENLFQTMGSINNSVGKNPL